LQILDQFSVALDLFLLMFGSVPGMHHKVFQWFSSNWQTVIIFKMSFLSQSKKGWLIMLFQNLNSKKGFLSHEIDCHVRKVLSLKIYIVLDKRY